MNEYNFENRIEQDKPSSLARVYEMLHATTPLEMSNNYTEEDQKLLKSGAWDYDNSELITNKVKVLLEQLDDTDLTEDERFWKNETLWFWYHHAISCAVWSKQDKEAAQQYSKKALELQPDDHPNKITRLLSYLVCDQLSEAEEWAEKIKEEPEKSTAASLLSEYKERGFFKK
jgi:predicted Zn-dependent protease